MENMTNKTTAQKELFEKYIKIVCVVALYWFISISTVFINKTLLSSLLVDAPLFVTWTQCVISVLICFCWESLSKLYPNIFNFPESSSLKLITIKNVLPVTILFILMVSFSNYCLSKIGVSFYFLSRSLTTVFNVIFSYTVLGIKTSANAILCCVLIIAGFGLGIDQENFVGSFSLVGTILGVLSSLFLSLYSIYTKKVLPKIDNHILLLSYYNNLYSCVLFIPFIIYFGELSTVKSADFDSIRFWLLIVLGGVFGFLIGFVTALQIQVTSPLTHNISGTAKACAQTVIATYWYNELRPWLWWFSNFVVMFGSAGYARIKQLEMAEQHKKTVRV